LATMDYQKVSYGYNDEVKNAIFVNGRMNLENTIALPMVPGLSFTLDAIAYDNAPDWKDYFKGRGTLATINAGTKSSNVYAADDNLAFQVSYTNDMFGSVAFGMIPRIDYESTTVSPVDASDEVTIDSSFVGGDTEYKGTSFWLDANLSKLLGEKGGLAVYVDGTMIKYLDQVKYGEDLAAGLLDGGANKITASTKTGFEMYFGVEGSYKVSDALSFSAAAQVATMIGAEDYWKAANAGDSFKTVLDADKAANALTDYYADSYKLSNYACDMLNAVPLTVSAKVAYKIGNITPFISDTYRVAAGNLTNIDAVTDLKIMHGYYDKNEVEMGATIAANKKATFGLALAMYQYLGIPEASDLYTAALTTNEQKDAADDAFATAVRRANDTMKLTASFTYTY
jgi:hypothetical protein